MRAVVSVGVLIRYRPALDRSSKNPQFSIDALAAPADSTAMVKKTEAARGGPVTVSFMGTSALVARAVVVAAWIERTGNYAPSHGGAASMSHVYRVLLQRGLEAIEKEMAK